MPTSWPGWRTRMSSSRHSVGVSRTGSPSRDTVRAARSITQRADPTPGPGRARARHGAARRAAGPAVPPWRTAWSRSRRRPASRAPILSPEPVRPDSTMTGARDQVRSSRMTATPSRSGRPRSRMTASGGCWAASAERLPAGRRGDDVVAAGPQVDAQRTQQRGLVLHDEHAGPHGGHARGRTGLTVRCARAGCHRSSPVQCSGNFWSRAMFRVSTFTVRLAQEPERAALGELR